MKKQKEDKTIYRRANSWQLVFFGANDTATNASLGLFMAFFLLMSTENLLLSAVIVGFIMTGSRLLDGFTDPIIGALIDKTVTRFGKFRPFLIVGSVIINLGVLMVFGNVVQFESLLGKYIWLIVWYIIYIIGYTFQTACTKAAQAQLTNDPAQRPILGAINSVYTMIFFTLFYVFAFKYVLSFGGFGAPGGYRNLALIIIAVNIFLTILAIIGIREADQPERYAEYHHAHKADFKKIFQIIKKNKALQMLIVGASTNKLAQTLTGAVTTYFFIYTVNDPELNLQQKANGAGMLLGMIGIFIGMWLAIRYSKKVSFVIGSWLSVAVGLLIIIIRPFGPEQQMFFLLLFILLQIVNNIANTNVIPMIGDVTDYELWRSGDFSPGTVGTTFSFIDKLVSSAAGSMVGLVLGAVGYYAGIETSSKLVWAFLLLMIGTPVLGHICSIIAYRFYPIDKAFYKKMHEEINERKTAAAE